MGRPMQLQDLERAIAASQRQPGPDSEPARTGSEWLKKAGFSEDFILQERALGLQKGSSYAGREDNWREQLAPEGNAHCTALQPLLCGGHN